MDALFGRKLLKISKIDTLFARKIPKSIPSSGAPHRVLHIWKYLPPGDGHTLIFLNHCLLRPGGFSTNMQWGRAYFNFFSVLFFHAAPPLPNTTQPHDKKVKIKKIRRRIAKQKQRASPKGTFIVSAVHCLICTFFITLIDAVINIPVQQLPLVLHYHTENSIYTCSWT